MRVCHRLYEPVLGWALGRKAAVVGTAIAALAVSVALLPKLGTEFLPELNEGTTWVNVMLPPSISVSEAIVQCGRIRAALHSVPEVDTVIEDFINSVKTRTQSKRNSRGSAAAGACRRACRSRASNGAAA